MKTLILIFMKLYCRKLIDIATMDHRNYLHGFLGSLIWSFGFLLTAYVLNYENWVISGIIIGLVLAFIAGLVWEILQGMDRDKRFTWRDVWASNIWFIPLWFIANTLRIIAPKIYMNAEKEFLQS